MSISFTQSIQSLHADQGRSALWGVAIAMFFLLLWLLWFFTPSLTLYANGHLINLTRRGTLVALLSAQEGIHLQAGQAAYIHPAAAPQQSVPATVLEVTTQEDSDQIQVTLYPYDDTMIAAHFAGGAQGEVQVEVETISPAVLLLQTLGQWTATPPVSLSPQR